jgi:uncharacterized protein DUF1569
MKSLAHRENKQELLSRLGNVRASSRRRWGKMSAPQMICHLSDAFRLYMGLIPVVPLGFPFPSKLLRFGALWVPMPWPRAFPTVPEADQEKSGTPPEDFERDVAEVMRLLHRFTSVPRDFEWPAHPHLGRMSDAEWMRLGYLHTNHHLRQFGA